MSMTAAPEIFPGQNPENSSKQLLLNLIPSVGEGAGNSEHTTGDFEYKLFIEHRRTDGTPKTDDQLRSEYVKRTDELIRVMTEGVEVDDPETGERSTRVPDYVIFLDKSARPVAWLTRELWPKLAPAPGEPVPPMPKMGFVNIDREQWRNVIDPNGSARVEIDKIDKSIIRSLRSIFIEPKYKPEGLNESIDNAPSELDSKTVLIVDEVNASGKTLEIAQGFFRRAFPSSRVAGVHWMGGQTAKQLSDGRISVGNIDLPVWYREDTPLGRGIGNRDERISSMSPSTNQRQGSPFLGTRLQEQDDSSTQLRKEIKFLAHDPDVLIIPSTQRIDFEKRATVLNGLKTLRQYLDRKHALDAQTPRGTY